MCILFVYTLLKVVTYYDLTVLSMSWVSKKVWMGCASYFWIFGMFLTLQSPLVVTIAVKICKAIAISCVYTYCRSKLCLSCCHGEPYIIDYKNGEGLGRALAVITTHCLNCRWIRCCTLKWIACMAWCWMISTVVKQTNKQTNKPVSESVK